MLRCPSCQRISSFSSRLRSNFAGMVDGEGMGAVQRILFQSEGEEEDPVGCEMRLFSTRLIFPHGFLPRSFVIMPSRSSPGTQRRPNVNKSLLSLLALGLIITTADNLLRPARAQQAPSA